MSKGPGTPPGPSVYRHRTYAPASSRQPLDPRAPVIAQRNDTPSASAAHARARCFDRAAHVAPAEQVHMHEQVVHTVCGPATLAARGDRKSTRLNSSHVRISYAVFCLKKKSRT